MATITTATSSTSSATSSTTGWWKQPLRRILAASTSQQSPPHSTSTNTLPTPVRSSHEFIPTALVSSEQQHSPNSTNSGSGSGGERRKSDGRTRSSKKGAETTRHKVARKLFLSRTTSPVPFAAAKQDRQSAHRMAQHTPPPTAPPWLSVPDSPQSIDPTLNGTASTVQAYYRLLDTASQAIAQLRSLPLPDTEDLTISVTPPTPMLPSRAQHVADLYTTAFKSLEQAERYLTTQWTEADWPPVRAISTAAHSSPSGKSSSLLSGSITADDTLQHCSDTETTPAAAAVTADVAQPMPIDKPAKASIRSLLGLRLRSVKSVPLASIRAALTLADRQENATRPPALPADVPSTTVEETAPVPAPRTTKRRSFSRLRASKSLDTLRHRFRGAAASLHQLTGHPSPSTIPSEFLSGATTVGRVAVHTTGHPANATMTGLPLLDGSDSSSGEEEDEDEEDDEEDDDESGNGRGSDARSIASAATAPRSRRPSSHRSHYHQPSASTASAPRLPINAALVFPPDSPLPNESFPSLAGWRLQMPPARRRPSHPTGSEPTTPTATTAPPMPPLPLPPFSLDTRTTLGVVESAEPAARPTITAVRATRHVSTSAMPTSPALVTTPAREQNQYLFAGIVAAESNATDPPTPSAMSIMSSPGPFSVQSPTTQLAQDLRTLNISPNFLPTSVCDPNDLTPARTTDGLLLCSSSSNPHRPPDRVPLVPRSPLLASHSHLAAVLEQQIAELRRLQTQSTERIWCEHHPSPDTSSDEVPLALDMTAPPPSPDTLRTFKLQHVEQQQQRVAHTRAGMNHLATLVQVAAATPSIQAYPYRMVAYQLTLLDAALFAQIPPTAVLTHSTRTPNARIQASIDLFNYVTRVVEHSLLSLDEPAARSTMLHRWSKVAKALRDLRSYQMLQAVVGGLQTPPVRRLRRTWACVTKRDQQRVDRLQQLICPDQNYARYRGLMNDVEAGGWMVPCLGVFLLDATYLVSACKTANTPVLEDTRVQDLLAQVHRGLDACQYPETPPHWLIKAWSRRRRPRPRQRHRPALLGSLSLAQSPRTFNGSTTTNTTAPDPTLVATTTAPIASTSNGRPTSLHHRRSSSLGARSQRDTLMGRAQDRLPSFVVNAVQRVTTPTTPHPLPFATITPASPSVTATPKSSLDMARSNVVSGKNYYATRTTQFLIIHHLVTRPWMEDTVADRLSIMREPPRTKSGSGPGTAGLTAGAAGNATANGVGVGITGASEAAVSACGGVDATVASSVAPSPAAVQQLRRKTSGGSLARWSSGVIASAWPRRTPQSEVPDAR